MVAQRHFSGVIPTPMSTCNKEIWTALLSSLGAWNLGFPCSRQWQSSRCRCSCQSSASMQLNHRASMPPWAQS